MIDSALNIDRHAIEIIEKAVWIKPENSEIIFVEGG